MVMVVFSRSTTCSANSFPELRSSAYSINDRFKTIKVLVDLKYGLFGLRPGLFSGLILYFPFIILVFAYKEYNRNQTQHT